MTTEAALTTSIEELSGGTAILVLSGEIDLATAPQLVSQFEELADRGLTDVIIDAREVGDNGRGADNPPRQQVAKTRSDATSRAPDISASHPGRAYPTWSRVSVTLRFTSASLGYPVCGAN